MMRSAWVVAVMMLALGVSRAGAQVIGVACERCHSDRSFLVGKAGTPVLDSALFVTDSMMRDSRHAALGCVDCHDGFDTGYPHDPSAVPRPCQSCHAQAGVDWSASIHAFEEAAGDAAICIACHGSPHQTFGADERRSPVFSLNVAATCGKCHADERIVGEYFSAPEEEQARLAVGQYYQTVHGAGMTRAGLVVSATCNDCHLSHKVLPASSPESSVHHDRIAATCEQCHVGVLDGFEHSAHGRPGRIVDSWGHEHGPPVCVDCHSAHEIVRADEPRWFLSVVEECGTCHERVYQTYFQTYHGKVTALGFGLTAKCSDCHTAHQMLPASDVESSVYPMNLVETCARCHPDANQNFAAYYSHGDRRDRERFPLLYWPWLLMTSLLVSVWAFFAVHSALWLVRVAADRVLRRSMTDKTRGAGT
jgi:hypothetical protein